MGAFDKFKSKFSGIIKEKEAVLSEDYVELEADLRESKAKVIIKPFTLAKFDDVRDILSVIREGFTIAVLNIGPLKEKDMTELKRAIDKIKKTVEANEGDIAGFGENFLIATPSFAKVSRGRVLSTREEISPQEEPRGFEA